MENPELNNEIGDCTLRKKRGMITFSRVALMHYMKEDTLKEIFSNFFPMAIENLHTYGMYHDIKMYGYSQHFREIKEGEITPEYEITIIRDGNGVRIDKVIEKDYRLNNIL